jgi:hypothetical protein
LAVDNLVVHMAMAQTMVQAVVLGLVALLLGHWAEHTPSRRLMNS